MGGCLSESQRSSNTIEGGRNESPQIRSPTFPIPQPNKINYPPKIQHAPQLPKVILHPTLPKELPKPRQAQIKPIANEFIEVKVPKDFATWTEFQWISQPLYFIPESIATSSVLEMKSHSFQEKLAWFRLNMEKRRISWTAEKSEYLQVDRENILMSSNSQFQRINFYKEVKIVFKDEKETSDAGGLLRQWMSLCIKEIFNPELGLMKLCESPATYYKFNNSEFAMDLFEVAARILGVVMGKAIFERIPIECPLNYTILRQLCGQPIQINDIFTYDRDFYNGWKFMIDNSMTTMLQQNFCVYEFDEHGTQNTVQLKPNGFNVMVNSSNKEEYITLMTEYYCIKSISRLLDHLKEGLYKIIPLELLQVFQPYQLDIVVNGRQTINVVDLKENTIYSGCLVSDPVIKWFWEFVFSLPQEKLSRMLHFVTGNGRVPILGFKYLESNRGEFQKFHIKMVEYNSIDPYPKSHTCFNRLEIPRYPTLAIFQKYIEYVTVEMMHFGLD